MYVTNPKKNCAVGDFFAVGYSTDKAGNPVLIEPPKIVVVLREATLDEYIQGDPLNQLFAKQHPEEVRSVRDGSQERYFFEAKELSNEEEAQVYADLAKTEHGEFISDEVQKLYDEIFSRDLLRRIYLQHLYRDFFNAPGSTLKN